MKFPPSNPIRLLSLVAALVYCAADRPASAQECPLVFPPSPSNDLTAYITQYPYATNAKQQLISYFLVDVTNTVNKTNYLNPPIPYGLYPTWCVDEWDDISPTQVTVPGSIYTGALFSTCDPNLNSELPPGHPNTLVSSTNWQMVNYILNHQTYNGTNAYFWSVQDAINTLVGSGVGSVGFCGVTLNTPIPDGSMPDGSCGYPTFDPVVVKGLLTAASNNYASWVPACGDVYGAVYVTNPTNDQFLMLEVPIPCSPCIKVSKQVACLQPGNSHGPFGPTAQGFAADCPNAGPGNNPAFVYEITVTNCGTIALTNVIVSDNLLGDLTTNFFANPTNVFEPGASATMYFSMAFPTNATNTVTAQGQAQLAETVTNTGEVFTNGYPVADTATAVALVVPASISCGLTLYSPLDLDGNTNDSDVLLPSATYFSQPPLISFAIQVCNTGSAALSAVTLNAPALTSLGFTLPSGFSLAVGECTNFDLGSVEVTCSNQTFFSLSTTGTVEPDSSHCGVYDIAGAPLYVCSSCVGTVECSTTNTTGNCVGGVASVSGTVVLNCDVNDTNLSGDAPMSGVTVVLYGAASNSLVTNITDVNGGYSFTNLSAGVYYIAVETATNYVETYPPGVTNGVASVTLVACQNLTGVNFGYADTTPPQISVSVTPNQYFGCNPTNLPTDTNIAADVTAIVSCGTSNVVVTHVDTNINCLYERTYFITVTDTYGNTASTNVTFTWTSNSTPPAIYGAPTNAYLGCNPTNLPSDYTVTNGMTASNLCSIAPLTVTNFLTTNGCFVTNVFMITALDSCGNSTMTNVVFSWTENTVPPAITGTPTNAYLGCNPTNFPTISTVTNGMTASNACGTASLSVTPLLETNGCFVTNTFTITALDGCGNTSSTNVVYSWTVNSMPPAITGTPTNAYLGCNPTNLPTISTVTNGMSASNACGTASLSVTPSLMTNGCFVTNTFTITALDGCGNTSSTNVVYSWTVNSMPPAITGTPTNAYLGCNPTNLPTISTVTNGMGASNACGTATLSVTPDLETNGCFVTNTFTITALDGCGNSSSTNVVYSWTVNTMPPAITGTPTNAYLGCNPTNLPTLGTVTNGMSASNACGTATLSVTPLLETNGCFVTNTFTITALDGCGNTSSTNVVYSWTVNTMPPAITGTPTNAYLGCNPTNLPTISTVTNGMSASNACGTASLSVTPSLMTNGCFVTNAFTITALDGCGNTSSTNVVYSWTVNTMPPAITGTPTNAYLGCNPTNLPTISTVTNGMSASNACGTASLSVTPSLMTNGCFVTNAFTITALDGCGNTSSTNVVYSWTVNTMPPAITGTPTNAYLGCNPTNLPTISTVTNGMSASNACGTATLSVTPLLETNGCFVTNTFTITALDGCGNTSSTNAVYSWTVNTMPPAITGTPTNAYLGCNPTNFPTISTVTNGMSASNACGTATLSVSPLLVTNGCFVTNTFTITALDGCGNTSSTNVVYSWTVNTMPPVITGTPTNAYLGCNPTNFPTLGSIINGMTASNACGSATLSPSCVLATNGCYITNTFTIKATDGCGNSTTTNVIYSWTVNTTPPVIKGTPTNAYLGCNPTNAPTINSIISGMTASNACGLAALTPSCLLTTNGCYRTNTFTIKATDGCGNSTTTNVVYSWTVNTTPPVIHGTPSGAQFGCNPANLPTVYSVTNGMSASATCGNANLSVTSVLTNSGCFVTNIFTIKATDGCGNATSTNVVYSWTVNLIGPIVNCPSNVTVVTNICQMFCTFNACDWSGSCNGGYRYNNNWWQNYCGNNNNSQCYGSFTNWWNSCGASGNQCSTWWTNWNNNRPTNWWGCWSGGGYQNGNWYNGWNNWQNQNNQCFVPCAGNNPDGILNSCFNKVYNNGCVRIGNTNGGNCLTFTSCSSAQNCLNWAGNCGVLNNCTTNPSSCNAGCFGAQVLALQLNCDFGDYGCAPGYVGKCGDLVLCNPASPCNGCKVRDILGACNRALGGGACPQGCSVQYLCGLCSNLNQCFEGCQVSSWCSSNLCTVYIPTPAQTGTATVSDTCSPNPTLTYSDTITPASCGGTYVISREWMAVDSCGNSNTCTQLITVAQTNSSSVSGVVALACSGDGNLANNEGLTNVTVTLKNSQGSVVATTATDVNGNYSFDSIAPGSYTVLVTPPSGYTETYPSTSGNVSNITVSACQNPTVNFAYIGSTVAVQLIKTAPACMPCSGVITYCFAVTNTGNTCETLKVVDPLLGGTIVTQTSVAPGQGFVFSSNYTVGANICMLTNTASAIATGPTGKSATNTSTVTTAITTKCVTNEICGNFNSQNPGNGYVWCNAHVSCNPGKPCTIYCQNASVTLSCNDGKVYTFPVPDCKIRFTNCSSASCAFDGTKWNTTIPCSGDDQIFLSGCGIPWQADFANCHSVCWTGVFCCDTTGVNCDWQWSAACYNNNNFNNCGSVSVKPCHNVSCGYPSGDQCGTPENCKSSCQGGGCGGGGGNYTGSWSSTGSFTCH